MVPDHCSIRLFEKRALIGALFSCSDHLTRNDFNFQGSILRSADSGSGEVV